MANSRFWFTDEARPLVQLGLGDTRIPQLAASSWDTARWEDYISADARWGGIEPFWLDVSCYAHEVEFNSGRERFVDRWQAGTATVTFTNSDGWADLAGTPGAIASLSLRPGRAMRIGVELATLGTVWLWRGVVDSTQPDYDPVMHDIVTVNAIDVLGDVGSTKLPELAPDGADELVYVRLGRILDAAKFEQIKRIFSATTTKVIPTTMGGQVIDLLGVTADSAGGVVFSDRDGNIVFKNIGWQNYVAANPPNGVIGNIEKGVPGVPAIINPAYLHAPGPPITDVSTPDAPSLKLPNSFSIFATVRQPTGTTTGTVCLVGQMDGALREWIIVRELSNGDWGFGTSLNGVDMTSNIIPPFAANGATPITGAIERFALSVQLDDGVGTTVPALMPSIGTVSTPDTPDLQVTDLLYVFALVRCDDVDAAGTHTIAGQTVTTGTTMSWSLQINAGVMQWRISSNGTSFLTYTVASGPELAAVLLDGQDQYIGASIDFNTGVAGQARTALLVSTTGIAWTENNAYTVSGATGLPYNSPDPLRVGARSDGTSLWNGRVYWAKGYHDGVGPSAERWSFVGTDRDSFDEDLTYTDPSGRVWTLTTATAIDHLAAMRTTSLQAYTASTEFGGPRWLPVGPAQRVPSLLHTDRASPVRVGGYVSGGVLQQPWNGDIFDVTLFDGDPNLPGQIIWKMDPGESTDSRYLVPGAGGLTTPDTAADPIADRVVITAKVRKTTLVTANDTTIVGQGSASPNIGWVLRMAAGSQIQFAWSTNGTTQGQSTTLASAANVTAAGITADTDFWLRVTFDPVEVAGTSYYAKAAYSLNGTTFTDFSPGGVIALGATTVFNSTTPIFVGASGATAVWNGRIYWAEMRETTPTGTLRWRMDAADYVTGTTFASNGRTWTLTGTSVVGVEWPAPSWTDPRGRTWTVTGSVNSFANPPDVPGIPAVPGDICPTDWETSFDRADIATQVILNRQLPETIPVLRWNLGGNTVPPPYSTFLDMNSTDQKAATILRPHVNAIGVNAEPYLRNLTTDSVVRLTDVGDVTNQTRTYRVTGPAVRQTGVTGGYFDIPVVWTAGETGIGGVIEMSMVIAPPLPHVTNGPIIPATGLPDTTGQTLYGVEAYELTDLISIDSALFPTLASRVLATRGYTSMPRIEAVTLAAESGNWATMEMMATCRPELPSRYLCRLQKDGRMVFDRMMFATGVRHFMGPDSWTLRISLDDAAWAAV